MSRSPYPHKNLPFKKPKFDSNAFGTKKTARLGAKGAPLKLLVNSAEKHAEVEALCAEHGWSCVIELSPDKDEDIRALTFMLEDKVVATSSRLAGRNDPCPCGSGEKYKQCCAG